MIFHLFRKVMHLIGYRRVLYTTSSHGVFGIGDFWAWEFAPHLPKKDYTDRTFPFNWRMK